jgi:hypothetical protein
MLMHDGSDTRERWSPLARPRFPFCPTCGQATKDHTGPMVDRCAAVEARRRGFKPWMVQVLGELGETVPSRAEPSAGEFAQGVHRDDPRVTTSVFDRRRQTDRGSANWWRSGDER